MGKKILVVDDSKAIRQSMRFTLEQNSYAVEEAVDGQDALSKIENSTFDLVITDVNMPNMDGITFISEARKISEYKFTPMLVLTTESQDSMIEKGKAAGATGWIVKPFNTEKLLQAVKKVCG